MSLYHHLIIYDIADPKRLRRVARVCEDFGVRLQESVFECALEPQQLTRLQQRMMREIDIRTDSVRYIPLCQRDKNSRMVQQRPDQPLPNATPPPHWVV